MKAINQAQLMVEFPQAFAALPEPYQSDSCLDFYQDCNYNLCCSPAEGQSFALGEWEAVFNSDKGEWIAIL
jgi:hypothetical protein